MTEARNIPSVYNPKEVEDRYYEFWEKGGFFHAEVNPDREEFSIVIPPPNVTGQLHIGHALDNTIQDILIRWRRMQGYEALWLPGTDHAGLATQIKVEEDLRKDKELTRHDLGREKFIDLVWEWKDQYEARITNQLKKLGASCDWARQRFTMDEGCSDAVLEVFVRLYEEGLIYRGNYITNWCPKCRTALSDIEVEHEETAGRLHYVRYPLEDGSGHISVATTRPETILGDTAVAVNPKDDRYQHLVGKILILPIVGRRMPIIADEYVETEFGTGAVKVTPAHDPNDFEMGRRHNLPSVAVIGLDGKMTAEAGRYAGMDRYECRKALLKDLDEGGYLVRIDDHTMALGRCQRCDTVVEPLVSTQWFVRMKPLAGPAMAAVRNGRVTFVPERFTKIYLNWLENIRDWCISRQIWWGHRIPAYYCQDCGEMIVARRSPEKCTKCGGGRFEQDPDCLDTWFSSALWPFSTMGWPRSTPELKYFFPTSVLVTGYDIIFFWVARMIFSSLHFMGDIPFRHVLIHGLVRDAQGRKMSKSLGNGVDPLEVIRDYGADTLRFTLITGNTPGNDMRFQWERVEASRNFANKIWNASRFVMMNLEDFDPAAPGAMDPAALGAIGPVDLSSGEVGTGRGAEFAGRLELADRWILSRFNRAVAVATRLLERFELGEAARAVYDFTWDEFCDWYIELVKPRLYNKEDAGSRLAAQATLRYVLDQALRLLHPFMPFITEAIWQALPHQGESIMVAPWPKPRRELEFPEAEARLENLKEVIKSVRNIRAEMNVPAGKKSPVILQATTSEIRAALEEGSAYIRHLAAASELDIREVEETKPEHAATAVTAGVEVYLPLKGLIDIDKELERLTKEKGTSAAELAKIDAKLGNQGFLSKAPAEVVEKEKARKAELEQKLSAIEERLGSLLRIK